MQLARRFKFELMVDGLPEDPNELVAVLAHYPTARNAVSKRLFGDEHPVRQLNPVGRIAPVLVWPDLPLSWEHLERIAIEAVPELIHSALTGVS